MGVIGLSTRSAQPNGTLDPTAPAVRCEHLTKCFGTTEAVVDASFELPRGTILALLGPSGGGKTTALRLIAGFERPDAGTITVEGNVVAGRGKFVAPERRRVGMVFQDYALFPHMSVKDNVAFGLSRTAESEQRVNEVLRMVGLTSQADRMPHHLSGGQQQRVALARALAPNPAVILLDEPFSNLDAALRDMVRTEVREILREAGTSAIFVTHDQDEAFGLADVVAIMLDARVVQVDTPEEVYVNPASIGVAQFLGEANILSGEAHGTWVSCELGQLDLRPDADVYGPVHIVVRPESVRLHPEAGAVSAEVIAREFRGIYKMVKVRLPSGVTLSAVMGLHIPVDVGDTVQLAVNSTVAAFPA